MEKEEDRVEDHLRVEDRVEARIQHRVPILLPLLQLQLPTEVQGYPQRIDCRDLIKLSTLQNSLQIEFTCAKRQQYKGYAKDGTTFKFGLLEKS